MRQVNIHEAKTNFSKLVDAAGKGESFVIAKSGKPIARLVPLDTAGEKKAPRRLGFLEGKFNVPDDFDTMFQDEIIAMFEGRE
jgi:prevent-host-death family protein